MFPGTSKAALVTEACLSHSVFGAEMLWGFPRPASLAAASHAASMIRKHPHPLCQSKMEMGHHPKVNPVVPLSPTGDSVPHLLLLGTGDHCSGSAMSAPDYTRASRHMQLKGWNSSFY